MYRSIIRSVGHALPTYICTTAEIEDRISHTFPSIPRGLILEMTGVMTRRFVQE